MSFADTLGGAAAFVNLPADAKGTATIESKTNFIGSAPAGSTVIGRTSLVHRGRRTQVWQTRVVAETEKLDRPGGGWLVRIYDLRYQYPERQGSDRILGGGVELNDKLEVVGDWFGRRLPPSQR